LGSARPDLDDALRARLVRRYGTRAASWLDALPPVLTSLAERWQLELGPLIPLGHMSVVMHCRAADGMDCVLKVCLDRDRLASEAAALAHWDTAHVPSVLDVDTDVGALLIEAIVPGTMFLDQPAFPAPAVAELLAALHGRGRPDPVYRPVEDHVEYLFDASARHRSQRPELLEVVSPALLEQGRRLALQLASEHSSTVLLHGDLTPVNVLDGGPDRGLVAIDPAPCLGDPAFDAVDLLFWRAEDVDTIVSRADLLAPGMDAEPDRLLAWCIAFAGILASELAGEPGSSEKRIRTALELSQSDPL
jgi:streptomycin 6-kinase